ncbi:hypothetical protein KFE25_004492 [Diacronema lutheri]|uniref:Uncharacterized protein n=1 Tax=Diacronema lutheri TaxID=2081491 RepID=A0A8J5XA41_DIALT|nr:hypothetical protein KFE25_004492 [Diacronema lutheri]
MLPRARVAAACSAALVLVTVCALITLRGAASAKPGAATESAPTDMNTASCDDGCRFALAANGYIIGTAPLCDGRCMDCGNQDLCFYANPSQPGYGPQCQSGGKVCCCASNTNLTSSTVLPPAPVGSLRCADFCAEGGFGYGMVIGTAPICGSECSNDCDGKCSIATDYFGDTGPSCSTGAKRCCCARRTPAAKPTPRMPDHPSCNDWCLSAGYARGDMKGTAPACNGTCDGAPACFTATSTLSDYGDSCSLGGIKKCRCW